MTDDKVVREESFGVIHLQLLAKEGGGQYLKMDLGENINIWASGNHPAQWHPSFMQELALALARVDGTFSVVSKKDISRDKRLADALDRLTAAIQKNPLSL